MSARAARFLLLLAAAGLVTIGYMFGSAAPAGPVNVGITYSDTGEAETVELTDRNGVDVPVGSIAETFAEDDNTDAED